MNIWKYIGGFLLFRWLLGHWETDRHHNIGGSNTSDTTDYSSWRNNYNDYSVNDRYSSSLNDFHDEQDNYDIMDDD